MNRPEKMSAGIGGAVVFGVGALVSKVVQSAAVIGGLSVAGVTSGLVVMGGTMVGGAVAFMLLPAVGPVDCG